MLVVPAGLGLEDAGVVGRRRTRCLHRPTPTPPVQERDSNAAMVPCEAPPVLLDLLLGQPAVPMRSSLCTWNLFFQEARPLNLMFNFLCPPQHRAIRPICRPEAPEPPNLLSWNIEASFFSCLAPGCLQESRSCPLPFANGEASAASRPYHP